jgi:hypothetical protein
MKKVLFIAGLFIANSSFGQAIPNNDFETWAAAGPFMAPTGWAVSPGVRQSNQAHSGSWALQCTVDTFTSPATSALDTIAGMAYSGAMTMGPPTPGANLNGFAFTARPDSLTGFFKYHAMGPDSMAVSVTLSHWNSATNLREVVARATFTNGTNDSVYRRFSMPLQYAGTATPDTCVIQIQAANPQAPKHMGTSAWVDSIAFANHNTTAVTEIANTATFVAYPNPFTNTLEIQAAGTTKLKSLELVNLAGQMVVSATGTTLNTANIPVGTYVLRALSTDGQVTTQKVVKE